MRFKNNKITRTLGLLMALAMMICMVAATAVQTSAAVADNAAVLENAVKAYSASGYSDMTMTVLVFVIIFLVLALVAVVVVILVVTNKRKENTQGMNGGPNSMPSPAPTNPQSFNHVQPMSQPMNQPMNQPMGQPYNAQPMQNQAAPINSAPAVSEPLTVEGAGDTTVLGVGSAGFILLRKNSNEKISINKPEFFIGKEKAKVDYCITNNNSISRRHAKIKVRAGKCYISDLGSTNCTYINGTKLSPNQEIALIPGDKIKFSNEEFEFIG